MTAGDVCGCGLDNVAVLKVRQAHFELWWVILHQQVIIQIKSGVFYVNVLHSNQSNEWLFAKAAEPFNEHDD